MRTKRTRMVSTVLLVSALVLAACGGTDDDATTDPTDDSTTEDDAPEPPPEDGDEDADADTDGDEDAPAADADPIRVAYLQTGSTAPLFVTAEKYADEVGIELEMTRVASGSDAITGVATGQFDVGLAGIGSGTYNAFDEGLPVTYVAPMHAGYLEDYFIISSVYAESQAEAAELAEDMSHLAGETFAVNAPGVVTEALLGQALERVGLSMDEINLEYIPFPDQVAALANGGVVAAISSEPFPSQAEAQGAGYRPWDTPDEDPAPFTGILYNTDWADANPQAAEDFMRAYAMAAEDLATNGWDTEEVLDMLEEYTGSDPEVVANSRQHHIPADLSVDFDVLNQYQQFYMEQGTLNYDEIIPEEEFWDFTWRDAVLGN